MCFYNGQYNKIGTPAGVDLDRTTREANEKERNECI